MSEDIKTTVEEKLITHEYERFDIKTESKLLKALSELFEEQVCLVSEDEIINFKGIGVVDQAHVCMCSAKTTKGKIILRRFFDPTTNPNIPDIKFKDDQGRNQAGNSLYSSDYFLKIIKVINIAEDHFRIQTGTDNIGVIDTTDFCFLLAPRIESE